MNGGDSGPHTGLKALIAYREGRLPPAAREAVQEHLSLCSRCARLLLELRDFEAAAASTEAGAEPLREEAWEALARRLPTAPPAVHPAARRPARRLPWSALGAAAAVLLAVVGLWRPAPDRPDRPPAARPEPRPPGAERWPALAPLRISLAEAERRRGAAPGGGTFEAGKVTVAPRFLRRGGADGGGELLRAGGFVNRVRPDPADRRLTVAFSLAGHPVCPEYRLGLADRAGAVLWVGRRPGRSVLGADGTSVSVAGLAAGLYRLRVEGLRPEGADLLAEYLLAVGPG